MFWRDITLSVWRKKTTGLKTKKRLLPLVLAAALCSSPVWAEEATFTANFKDTDLKSFIETVGANLNKTIIMGPGVQGKVSIRTMTPLNERQYYQLFLNLLEAQGYAVVPMENDVLKVVKSSAAKVEPLPLVGEGSDNYAGDEMVTKVVPVRNVSVRELAPILRQMIDSAGSGNVVNYDPSNVIMLTGRASVVERLTEVIQRVDHAGNGRYPTTEQGLEALIQQPANMADSRNYRTGGYIKRLPKDPWGNDYQYLSPGEKGLFDVYTLGADGQENGEGAGADIGNWNLQEFQ